MTAPKYGTREERIGRVAAAWMALGSADKAHLMDWPDLYWAVAKLAACETAEQWPESCMNCPKCKRELRTWPLERGNRCAPAYWRYCIRPVQP